MHGAASIGQDFSAMQAKTPNLTRKRVNANQLQGGESAMGGINVQNFLNMYA